MIKLKGKICDIELEKLSNKTYSILMRKYGENDRVCQTFNSLDDLVELRNNLDHIIEFAKKKENNDLKPLNILTNYEDIIDGYKVYVTLDGHKYIINPKNKCITMSIEDYRSGKRFDD